ncbi:M48 family metallopeptidase [Actinokineospora diospyrosa]|uniref:Heat shock protein HtpX n=1 Tax=Actinokineospora diospyrosa TaxID=103728 RepID=A0ABT1ILC6_9PSEU|nr:M48 family metallopeptidase [Actinokineospora diospyrosa]MCP2273462.1 heat shock protein HtpX [Actinokineospora diospyrosa]
MPTRSLADDVTARPGANAATRAAAAVAVLVYLLLAGLLLTAAWLLAIARGFALINYVLAAALLGFVWLARPRLGGLHPDTTTLDRAAAPALFAVVDAVTERLGARRVWRIAISPEYNASYRVVGFRRRVVLTIGYPLWNLLDPAERVALVAHELAHGVNGDTSRGTLIAPSLNALVEAIHALRGDLTDDEQGLAAFGATLGRAVGFVVSLPLLGLLRLQERLLLSSSRRAEYHADHLAVTVAGAAAVVSLLHKAHLEDRALRALRTALVRRDPDPWATARAWLADLGPITVPEGDSTDSTHPPTERRIAAVLARSYPAPTFVSTVEEARRADHEMAPALRDVVSLLREQH